MGLSGKRIAVRAVHLPIPVAAPNGTISEERNVKRAIAPTRTPQMMSAFFLLGLAFCRISIRKIKQICKKKSERNRYVCTASLSRTPANARMMVVSAVIPTETSAGKNPSFEKSVLARNF